MDETQRVRIEAALDEMTAAVAAVRAALAEPAEETVPEDAVPRRRITGSRDPDEEPGPMFFDDDGHVHVLF